MKLFLLAFFLAIMALCLVSQPVKGEIYAAVLTCNPGRMSWIVREIMAAIIDILQLIEVTTIAAIAVLR